MVPLHAVIARPLVVHSFPFRLTDAALAAHAGSKWNDFWAKLKEGAGLFNAAHLPPAVYACNGRYVFQAEGEAGPRACDRVAAW